MASAAWKAKHDRPRSPLSRSRSRSTTTCDGAEGSGVGTWDLDFSTGKLDWSTTTRKLFGVASDAPVDYDLFLSLLDPQDSRSHGESRAAVDLISGDFDVRVPAAPGSGGRSLGACGRARINGPDGVPARSQRHCYRYRPRETPRGDVANAREPPSLDPRYGAGRHDRHRRAWHHAVLLQRRRASVRLHRAGGDRTERQRADAGAGSAAATTAISRAIWRPASGASSASAAS